MPVSAGMVHFWGDWVVKYQSFVFFIEALNVCTKWLLSIAMISAIQETMDALSSPAVGYHNRTSGERKSDQVCLGFDP